MTSEPSSRLRIAVLISGGGTTLLNLLKQIDSGSLNVEVSLVVSSSTQARGLEYARNGNIPICVVNRTDFEDTQTFSTAIFEQCRAAESSLVVMGGFLKHILIPADYENRVVNIHPSLIPAFCGKGYYGRHVHQAVLDYGAQISGCTVHFVDNEYDHGPIILQRTVPVLDDDDAGTLAARVFEQECEVYPAAIQMIADGKIEIRGRRVIATSDRS